MLTRLWAEFAPAGEVDGAVDRLVRHPHRGLASVDALQPDGDLLQLPVLLQPFPHHREERRVRLRGDGFGRLARSQAARSDALEVVD